MIIKKVLGYVLILLSIILSIATLGGTIKQVLEASLTLYSLKVFNLDSYDLFYAIGTMSAFYFMVYIILALWIFGRKLTMKVKVDKVENQ